MSLWSSISSLSLIMSFSVSLIFSKSDLRFFSELYLRSLMYFSSRIIFSCNNLILNSRSDSSSFNVLVLSFTRFFIIEKIPISRISSIIILRSLAVNCINGTNDAEPNTTICVNDLKFNLSTFSSKYFW